MKTVLLAAALALALAAAAGAFERFPIEPSAIGGVKVGATAAQAKAKLGAARVDHLEGGLMRFVFAKARTEVYFREGGTNALGVVTWNKAFRTAAGLGPCSRVADLRAAYAGKLKPFRFGGVVVAYRLGNLMFTAEGARLGDVMLSAGGLTAYVALNATECR